MLSAVTFNLGLHFGDSCTVQSPFNEAAYCCAEEDQGHENWSRVVGWIPVLGIAVGIERIAKAILRCMSEKEENGQVSSEFKLFTAVAITRGLMEVVCLGPLLFLMDMAVTTARIYQNFASKDEIYSV